MPVYKLWNQSVDIEIPQEIFPDENWLQEKDILFNDPRHDFFESCYERKRLHYRINLPPVGTPIRAIVVWQHGIHGQSGFGMRCAEGRFTDMAKRVRMMNAKGYAIYAHDQLGHGFSEGERFYIPNWTINRDDLVRFVRLVADKHAEGTPIFLSGDSYGGCLAFHATHVLYEGKQKDLLGCALNCPAIEGDLPALPVLWFLRYILAPLFATRTPFFMPHPITNERIWKEVEPRDYYSNPKNIRGLSKSGSPFCLGTAVGLVSAMEVAQEIIPSFRAPFHINHGSNDHGVPLSGSQRLLNFSKTKRVDKELNVVVDGYHGLFSQLDADETMKHEIEWIEKMIIKNKR
mmetsp:Transcript_35433/g.38346  ORF Transcript_35433/g.38346 Transcript_35433/m.38346 type:complete len:346 (-) Transcript_35433:348-1385(-)